MLSYAKPWLLQMMGHHPRIAYALLCGMAPWNSHTLLLWSLFFPNAKCKQALLDVHHLPSPCSWEPGSYGYHGDDGHKFGGNGKGEDYGPKFSKGDTVGACYHLGKQEMFFT